MRKSQTFIILLLNPGPNAHHSIANSQETRVGRKGKEALIQMLATRGEGGLVSESQLPVAAREADIFKGVFQGYMDRGQEQDGTVGLDSHLDISNDSHLNIGDDGHNWLR